MQRRVIFGQWPVLALAPPPGVLVGGHHEPAALQMRPRPCARSAPPGVSLRTISFMKPLGAYITDHSPPTSVPGEFSEVIEAIRKYRAAQLPDNVQDKIHRVAINAAVSQQVIAQIESGLQEAHTKFTKIYTTSAAMVLVPFAVSNLMDLMPGILDLNWNFLLPLAWILAAELYIIRYFVWRRDYGQTYIADYLARALEFGLMYQDEPTDTYLRDKFALGIQGAAIRYSVIFRRSGSTRFFAEQVRATARSCRNDIISLIPGLVTAGDTEIEAINSDIARLIIRSQTGYWYQTSDIARQGMPIPWRYAAWVAYEKPSIPESDDLRSCRSRGLDARSY